ncbi:ankyrin repeat domain-containing protein [Paenibacillus pabuli]|uniref:ankyrin repeat domain-containing protein n=1 Tax=Paenibacillus pabuli TaxID=1472 RepID=UPI0007833332|nr:ankyrin repeat domain-containing protein [Paenibacillus pabuli]MEC0124437.1 ankyrin repeat domain-containing protein [Paenibacillus pabuli]
MEIIYEDETLAVGVIQAIHTGDIPTLKRLLAENPGLVMARIMERDPNNKNENSSIARTLLHVVTDWPGHFPNGSDTVRVLVEFGADVNARFMGSNTETPLHWAASCNDIQVLDELLDAGADIEAPGAVIAGGTPLDDAVAFSQWDAARRLVERGATIALWHAAALGEMDAIKAHFTGNTLSERYPWGASSSSPPDKVTVAFWCACHGGQLQSAEYLLEQGAELNWISVWDGLTPLDAAKRSSAAELIQWLASQGAKSANELG